MRHLILTIPLILISLGAWCQALNGRITDEKGEPLPGATVFLTRTQYMSATDADGRFALKDVPKGTYQLAIKMLGFEAMVQKVIIADVPVVLNLKLKEESKTLGEVTISEKAKANPEMPKYLKWFTQYFIGESADASQCRILNPEVLHFKYDEATDELTARTDKLLQIENQGLGYKVNYLLSEFKLSRSRLIFGYTGYPYFEELKGGEAQQKRWAQNRKAAYLSSMQHFIAAAYRGTAEQEGFLVYPSSDEAARQNFKVVTVPAGNLFSGTGIKKLKPEFNYHNKDTAAIFVYYKEGAEPYSFQKSGLYVQAPFKQAGKGQLSKLEPLTNDIRIDSLGQVNPEQGFLVSGYWAWTKVAELMPVDYGQKHGQSVNTITATNALPVTAALTQAMNETVANIEAYEKEHPRERIYLQLNKPWYGRRDTIWFKAYIIDQQHKLSDKSIAAYAELIAPDDSVVQHITLQLTAGMANAELTLPETAKAGNYRIRAWTNWMKNEGEDNYYERVVNIGGLKEDREPSTINHSQTTAIPDIQFFPEGGTLVTGVKSKVAFKALNVDGTAANITGTITDDQNNKIADLQSAYEGMGQFSFTPQASKSYTAKVLFADGRATTISLPKANARGLSLSAESDDKDEQIKLTVAADEMQQKAHTGFYIIATSNGKITYRQAAKLNGQSWQTDISQKQLPSGITKITLFSELSEPLAERLMFLKNNDNLQLGIARAKEANIEQTVLTIVAKTEKEEAPASGSFSASVINDDLTPTEEPSEPGIINTLLLSNELHGIIHNPNYYLGHESEMDLLMLTQGYRKFDWKKSQDKTAQKYKAEDGLTISGKVLTNNDKPAAGAKVTIAFAAAHISADTLTDNEGRFTFRDLDISGKMLATLKALTATGSNKVKIVLDMPEKKVETTNQTTIVFTAQTNRAMQQRYIDDEALDKQLRTLKTVTIKEKYDPDKKMAEQLAISANLNGPGHADQVIMGDKLDGCPDLIPCLIGKLAMVTINGDTMYDASRGGHFVQKTVNGRPQMVLIPMTVSVNGFIVQDVSGINPNDVYSIEVLTSVKYKAIYGHDAGGGLLLITLKQGIAGFDAVPREKAPGIYSFAYDGYYKARTFYQPKYQQGDTQPSAIYWKPDILTDNDGKATISFNNAGKGHYRVLVEGIDGEGRLGHAEFKYEVK